MFYTGVGSRETPEEITKVMSRVAGKLASRGWTLRSGGAKGADAAFKWGWYEWFVSQTPWPVIPQAEIYLPWDGYEGHGRDGLFGANILPDQDDKGLCIIAEGIAAQMHPNWAACKQGARKMHTRNVYQVLGRDLKTPSKMLIAWTKLTKAGQPMGGTATAIRLAEKHNIPCFNLNKQVDLDRVLKFLED